VYMSSISLGQQEFRLGSLVSATEVSSMVVSKSADGGLTWTDAVSAARSTVTTQSNVDAKGKERGTFTSEFLDKEWISVGPNINDPSKDSIYLTYTDFATTYTLVYADEVAFLSSPFTQTAIKSVHSEDGGVTWSAPVAISPTVLQAQGTSEPGGAGDTAPAATLAQQLQDKGTATSDANRTVQGSQPKVMKDGSVVATYLDTTNDGIQQGFNTVMFVKSTDGGRTWSDPKQIGLFREPHGETRSAFFRSWGTAFPQLAVGPKNDIYVATTALPEDKPVDDGDIYLMRSLDGGVTWQASQRINTDKTNRPQFYPSIDVDPSDVVHIMWADMRDDPQEVRYNIYYSRSEDQGKTWGFSIPGQNFTAPDTRVSDFASNSLRGFPRGAFIGDYFSLAATDGEVYMVWADTRLGEFGGANQQIAFARQKAIKPPSLFLNPPAGAAGRTVDIQGFGFQPVSDIQLLVSGVIVANQRTNEKGEFQSSIYMPLTGEGPTSITAYDETGNVATSSFYTQFGFDTLQKSLEQINGQLGLPNQGATPGASPAAKPAASPAASPIASPAATKAAAKTPTKAPTKAATAAPTPTAAG
ncbi:MAG: sialidase family protein, partial [Thermomicrobiales bacterium]